MHRRLAAIAAATLAVLILAQPSLAELKLPSVFGDHMVLQQKEPIKVWGWADPGQKVTVKFGGKSSSATADKEGHWSVKLGQLSATRKPLELTISTAKGEKKVLRDVLVGEVWVCSGQSNMEQGITMIDNAQQEIAAADHPDMRLFLVAHKIAQTPEDDVQAQWTAATPQSVVQGGWGGFSAAAYFFGRKLEKELDVPIGLIESSWGGTIAEAWTSPAALAAEKRLSHTMEMFESAAAKDPKSAGNPNRPSVLYNGMLAPIVGLPVRGFIWYQGESNVPRGWEYRIVFPTMIQSWRTAWRDKDLPFYFVQIAPFKYATGLKAWGVSPTACAELWDSQLYALHHVDHTGMVVIHDVGNVDDIHPRNKVAVGERLAAWALSQTYGNRKIPVSGPIYRKLHIKGDKAEVEFDYSGSGLATRDGKAPDWFEVAGDDKVFHPATAEITGNNSVRLSSAEVKSPKAVRLGWHETASPNLINKEGLPVSPFRTDDWPLATQPKN